MENENEYPRGELERLIEEVMGVTSITPLIGSQITKYHNMGMSYKEIGRCVHWYAEVRGMKIDPLYGISFVLYHKEESNAYFEKLKAQEAEKTRTANEVATAAAHNIIFKVDYVKHKKHVPKSVDISSIELPDDFLSSLKQQGDPSNNGNNE